LELRAVKGFQTPFIIDTVTARDIPDTFVRINSPHYTVHNPVGGCYWWPTAERENHINSEPLKTRHFIDQSTVFALRTVSSPPRAKAMPNSAKLVRERKSLPTTIN
tara:strand:- start:332 stop:649 length:318 start_codon:yes stop_codon:yes gene_type:complete